MIEDTTMTKRKINPVHPGRILREEFMEPVQTLYDLEKATIEAGSRIRKTTERLNFRRAA